MSIIVNVKGVDDFGKSKINSGLSEYSLHYPRPRENDIMIYYYPKGTDGKNIRPSVGIYQMKEEVEHYSKGGFQYCRGTMKNLVGNREPRDLINRLFKDPNHEKLARKIDNTIYNLGLKHNPELYDENGKAKT